MGSGFCLGPLATHSKPMSCACRLWVSVAASPSLFLLLPSLVGVSLCCVRCRVACVFVLPLPCCLRVAPKFPSRPFPNFSLVRVSLANSLSDIAILVFLCFNVLSEGLVFRTRCGCHHCRCSISTDLAP